MSIENLGTVIAFLVGLVFGMALPFICIYFYNIVGIHLGDLLEDEADDSTRKENEKNDLKTR